jgi:nitrogen regulatory protein PII
MKKVEQIVSIISKQGKSVEPGDGLIYVSPVEQVIRGKT